MDRLIRKKLLLDSGTIENFFKYPKIIGVVYPEVTDFLVPFRRKWRSLVKIMYTSFSNRFKGD